MSMLRNFLFALALSLAACSPAWAGLAINSQEASNVAHHSATSPLSWSFTNTSGTLLIVGFDISAASGSGPSVSSVTYNGVSMTQLSNHCWKLVSGFDLDCVYLYYLTSPATGANTVSITFTYPGSPTSLDSIGGAISFTGANLATPFGTPASADDGGTPSTPATVSVTGTASGDFVVSAMGAGNSWTTAVSPTTISALLNNSGNTAGDNLILAQQSTSGGSVTVSANITAADHWGIVGAEVMAASSSSCPMTRRTLGVGC